MDLFNLSLKCSEHIVNMYICDMSLNPGEQHYFRKSNYYFLILSLVAVYDCEMMNLFSEKFDLVFPSYFAQGRQSKIINYYMFRRTV